VSEVYAGKQFVGMDVHRRRSVVVRMTEAGERLETVQGDAQSRFSSSRVV
jgi:hypothetical protein